MQIKRRISSLYMAIGENMRELIGTTIYRQPDGKETKAIVFCDGNESDAFEDELTIEE